MITPDLALCKFGQTFFSQNQTLTQKEKTSDLAGHKFRLIIFSWDCHPPSTQNEIKPDLAWHEWANFFMKVHLHTNPNEIIPDLAWYKLEPKFFFWKPPTHPKSEHQIWLDINLDWDIFLGIIYAPKTLGLLYSLEQMKWIIVQIVDNDNRITLWSLKKIHCSVFEYLNDKVWFPGPLKSMVIFILLNIGMAKFL